MNNFSFSPQFFLTYWRTLTFSSNLNYYLQTLSVWKSLKCEIWEMVNPVPGNNILALSMLKAFAHDNLNVTQNIKVSFQRVENIFGKGENAGFHHFLFPTMFLKGFLAPLAEGQRAVVMALCPWWVCASVNFFFKKKSLQKLLTGFLPYFTGMFLRWSSFKFLQIIVFHLEFWLPYQPK